MPELLLCMSQQDADTAYRFKMTNINVYSFEEAVYHCYHYWKQSVDDFTSEEFLTWVREGLGLSFLSARIKDISRLDSFSERLITFLSLADYFDEVQLAALKTRLAEWENRLEWEKLKERADYLMQKADPSRAYVFYRKALAMDPDNKEILNNMAVALMQLEHFEEAVYYLDRATKLDERNIKLALHLAEAAIYAHQFEKALKILANAEKLDANNADIQYLHGELNIEMENIRYSLDNFKRALELNYEPHYIYRIADVYIKLRQYDKALSELENVKEKDEKFLRYQGKVYAAGSNMPAAIKCIERALLYERENPELWVLLARYQRMDYNLTSAAISISKALALAPEDDIALLESARIKKAQGKTKDYQVVLHNILNGFKRKYRELSQMEV